MNRALRLVLAGAGCFLVLAPAGGAAYDGGVRIVGTSCRDQFETDYLTGGFNDPTGGSQASDVSENHGLDSRFVHLAVTRTIAGGPKPAHYEIRWKLAPGVILCPSFAKLGYGNDIAITQTSGSVSGDVTLTGPVRVKLRGRLATPMRPRQLSTAAVRSLITGWARRGCALLDSKPSRSGLLLDLAERGHARQCKGPGNKAVPSAPELLQHLSAFFNKNSRGMVPPAGKTTSAQELSLEYYRVLAQLASGVPTPPP